MSIRSKRVSAGLLYYGSIPLFALVMLFFFLDVPKQDTTSPMALFSDSLMQTIFVKPFLEGETPFRISRLGAPYHHCAYLFPQGANLDYGLAVICGAALRNVFAGMNTAWMLKLALAGLAAAWSFRRLGISPAASYFLAYVFAFAPYAFLRNISHFNLSTYFVPLVCCAAIAILRGDLPVFTRRNACLFGFLFVLAGFGDLYVAAFSLFLFSIALAASLFRKNRWAPALCAGAAIACVLFGALLNTLPGLIALSGNKASLEEFSARRSQLGDANKYALRPLAMLLPPEHHPIPAFGRIRTKMAGHFLSAPGSHESAPLGTTASIGFLLLLLGGFLSAMRGPLRGVPEKLANDAAAPFALAAALMLLACFAGFSNIVIVLASVIRVYGRVSIFIGFLSLVALGSTIDAVGGLWRGQWTAKGRMMVYVLALGLAVVVLFDQGYPPSGSHKSYAERWAKSSTAYEELGQFVSGLEAQLPEGAMVYQLPAPFGEEERNYWYLFSLKPYVASKTLRWSFAPFSYVSAAGGWHGRAAKMPVPELVELLRREGFAGIWVDMAYYRNSKRHEALLEELRQARNGGDIIFSKGKNYAFAAL